MSIDGDLPKVKPGTVGPWDERGEWREVNREQPCPVCEKPNWCGILSDDSIVACRRQAQGAYAEKTDKNGASYYLHRLDGEPTKADHNPRKKSPATAAPERAAPDTLNRVYSALIDSIQLKQAHTNNLLDRKFTPEEAARRGYRTLPGKGRDEIARKLNQQFETSMLLSVPGFILDGHGTLSMAGLPGLLIPVRDARGRIVALMVRPDRELDGKKYLYLSSKNHNGPGPGAPAHVPLGVAGPAKLVRLTEGVLKADLSAVLSRVPTIAAPGASNWGPCIPVLKALKAEVVRLAFDADWRTNSTVARSFHDCAVGLGKAGLMVEIEHWDQADGKGIDDLFASGKSPEVATGDDAIALLREVAKAAGIAKPEPEAAEIAEARTEAKGSEPEVTGGETQAQKLIRLAKPEGSERFHSPEGKAFATVPVNGHNETHAIKSSMFKHWVIHAFYKETGRPPSSDSLQSAIASLEAEALYDGDSLPVHVRVAEFAEPTRPEDPVYFIDLCNDKFQAVRIDRSGWKVVSDPPVRFRRARGMKALPTPRGGGAIKKFFEYLNVDERDRVLVLGWLAGAMRPRGPYFILRLEGEPGSAKTSSARATRTIIDDNVTILRSEPKNERDLMIAATNSWVLSFDNLSYMSQWLSDALCRLATGGGFATRELYADAEEVIFDATRPIILNGIEGAGFQSDLIDRSIVLTLPTIPEDKRRSEAALRDDFDRALPEIFGALLDVVSGAMRILPTIKREPLPRMADAALFAEAACRAAGYDDGQFIKEYERNKGDAINVIVEASPVAQAVKRLAETEREWKGSATSLLERLKEGMDAGDLRARGWPKNGQALSGKLNRLAPSLRRLGIEITFDRTAIARPITIARRSPPKQAESASSASAAPILGTKAINDTGLRDDASSIPVRHPSSSVLEVASSRLEVASSDSGLRHGPGRNQLHDNSFVTNDLKNNGLPADDANDEDDAKSATLHATTPDGRKKGEI